MRRFSLSTLVAEALTGHRGWERQWRSPEPKAAYDAAIVGGGGHGLATAYYLAKEHSLTNIAVLEKGWIGGGNTGRNTTIIRSNYLQDESAAIYEHALKLWEGLSQELNYNVMFSQRGVMMLAHNTHDVQSLKRHIYANRLSGIDNEWLSPREAKAFCPPLNISPDLRHPVVGAALQRRGGVARHDAVAWGYARAADAMGVDIIQNCEVLGFRRGSNGAIVGVETAKGYIATPRVGVVAAGHTSVVMARAGLRLPLESFPLQALVSEPVKPVFPCVVMSNTVHAYISQSDKGETRDRRRHGPVRLLQPAGRAQHRRPHARGDLRAVPRVPAPQDAAQLGRHRRRDARPLAYHRPDADPRPLRQLRLGHRWLQGDAGLGPCVRAHHRQGRAASHQRPLQPRPLPHRLPHR